VRKLLIINEGLKMDLTFEEIFEMYRPLIMSEVYKFSNFQLDFDDKFQLASIGLWQAYVKYDIEKGVGFGLLANVAIRNSIKGFIRNSRRSKRSGLQIVSADRELETKRDEVISIIDTLTSGEDIESNLILSDNLKRFMRKITDKQKETIALSMSGKKYNEIADILGVGSTTISMRMMNARKIFNECMAG
jgi:RNA polymerase sigma factor (sigma-70 family)